MAESPFQIERTDSGIRFTFALDALQRPHSVSRTASLNGEPLPTEP